MKAEDVTQREPALPATRGGAPESPLEIDVDLDWIVYDPEDRVRVRDRLNGPRQPVRDEAESGSPD